MSKYGNKKTVIDGRRREWDQGEVADLISMRTGNVSIPECARRLGRTEHSVESKCSRLVRAGRLGSGLRPKQFGDPIERFWGKVDIGGSDECWNWSAKSMSGSGYGLIRYDIGDGPRLHGAHRIAFFLKNGRTPLDGMEVLHGCDNKLCCNNRHLSEGTRSQNVKEAWDRGLMPKAIFNLRRNTKVNEHDVREIRRRSVAGEPRKILREEFGLSKSGMDHIVSGRHWAGI